MTEVWKPINGFDMYEISSFGRVRSASQDNSIPSHLRSDPRVLSPRTDRLGYLCVNLYKQGGKKGWTKRIHRLVATTFIDPSKDKCSVLHGDGDKTNNCVSNLRFGSPRENYLDSVRHGTNKRISVIGFKVDGSFVAYNQIADAEKDGYSSPSISACLHGRQQSHADITWQVLNADSLNTALRQWGANLLREMDEYRSALEKLARLGNGGHYGNSLGNQIAQEVLRQYPREEKP